MAEPLAIAACHTMHLAGACKRQRGAQVYENYNKFIAATDIIRAMKSNVDGMDSTMTDLKQKIGAHAAAGRLHRQALRSAAL